jgi:choline dehydrogenase-like flavoprotein
MADHHYDIAIIGTGAGGGTLAYALANTGKRILLLERGDWLRREKENWDAREVFVKERYHTTEQWYDKDGNAFRPGTNYYVGGNTKVYGAVLLRFREKDFEIVNHYDGLSPEWPLKYRDLEPYYAQAERLYLAHGERGLDPTEPWSSSPFPYPAVKHEPRMQEVFDGLRVQGLKPFPLPVGVELDEENPHLSACIKCDTFDGFPCLVGAKVAVFPILAKPNVTLITRARVTHLATDASGRTVNGIIVERDGATQRYSADIVVVACGAINSAALLLRSASDRHPTGLANSSDQVGRNFMFHNNSAMLAVSRKPNPSRFTKTIGLNDFYFGPGEGHFNDNFNFPLGHIQTLGKSLPAQLEGDAPKLLPGVGLTLEFMAAHATDWWLTTEDLPMPHNRVTLTRDGAIQLHYTPNNTEPHKRLLARLKHALEHVEGGMTHFLPQEVYLAKRIPLAGVAHQCGTVRFGLDPKTSVLDVNCKAHDLDNLYVVDSGFFPSSTSSNPSLTIIANALRVAEHLKERLA